MPITDKNGRVLNSNQIRFKAKRRIKTIFLEIWTGFLWWGVGFSPFHCWRRFFYRLSGMKIGKGSTIHMMARIYYPSGIRIGTGTLIGEKATLDGRRQLENSQGGLEIGNHVDIASEVMIWTSEHDLKSSEMTTIEEKVTIGDYVFIGPRAIIMPGVSIGEGAVVAAGAIVTKDVASYDIVAGVPAKVIDQRPQTASNYRLGRPRLFQ
jgi:maltose O-acetyltransferase